MMLYKIIKTPLHNIHYKVWALVTALVLWYIIHDTYQTTVMITVPIDNTDIIVEEKNIIVHAQLNKLSYYSGYHSKTRFFLEKTPIHDIITVEKHAIVTHPSVRIVDFYPTVIHVKKISKISSEVSL